MIEARICSMEEHVASLASCSAKSFRAVIFPGNINVFPALF
jgi:hypothetical protein